MIVKKQFLRLITIVIILTYSCKNSNEHQTDNNEIKYKTDSLYVETFSISEESTPLKIEASGIFRPRYEQDLIARRSGNIVFFLDNITRSVKEGELLLQLDNTEIDIERERIANNIFNSKLNYESELLSQEVLLKGKRKGIIDTVRRKLRISTGLSENQLLEKEIELEFDKSKLVAPFLGKFYGKGLKKGMMVTVGQVIGKFYSHDDILFEAEILESDVGLVALNNTVLITSLNGKKYTGKIESISPIIENNGVQKIFIKIINGLPSSGTKGICQITTIRKKGKFIPKSAIVNKNGKNIVFTVKNGKAHWNYVSLGDEVNNMIHVIDGLNENLPIITSNNAHLNQDNPVKVISDDQILN